jgi:AcrR family transcriptional regulator
MQKKARGRPTQDEAGKLTENLISVAGKMFEEEGFSAVSMNRIAATAGIGKDTLYSRFCNKEALFFAVIDRQAQQHRSTCPTLEQASSSPGAISRNLLFYREGQRFPQLGEIFMESYDNMFVSPMEKYFTFLKTRDAYKGIAAEKLARLFCNSVLSTLNNRLIVRHDMPDAREVKRHIDTVVQIFTEGLGKS